jgi:glutamyl-tRNA reductase
MLQDLVILHRPKPGLIVSDRFPVWTTCLRTLAFVGHETPALQTGDELYTRNDAYRFLLEVICGLRSPVAGETEVFGQFKAFARLWSERDPRRLALIQRLLNDAKAVRSEHLSHLGTQSYGGWLRKNLRSDRIHVLGAGQLAGEILPYLKKQGQVVIHARRPETVKLEAETCSLSARKFDAGALIVAASLPAGEIRAWLDGKVPGQIFDLRDTSGSDPIGPASSSLRDIFREIEANRPALAAKLDSARKDILARSLKASEQSLLRPLGWDDLCA